MEKEDASVNHMTKWLPLLFRKGVSPGCFSGIKLKEYVL
jgi:hypothetical protein